MNDLALWRDEVNEPLGFLPTPEPRRTARIGWKIMPIAAPAMVAAAMAAFMFDRRDEPPRAEPLALKTQAPRSPDSAGLKNPAATPAATIEQIEAKSGVKVMRQGGGSNAPSPLIIDVQQALAAARKGAPTLQR